MDIRTPQAIQLRSIIMALLNLDYDELKECGVAINDHQWGKWNRDPIMVIAKLGADELNALTEIIGEKYPSAALKSTQGRV